MDDDTIGLADYPLGTQRPELIKTLTGKKLADITLAAIVAGKIGSDDIRIAPETLLMQARIAELSGRKFLSPNFRRAAELCHLADEKVMQIYEALRPFRCTKEDLEALAAELEQEHGAVLNAGLIREACDAYAQRGFLKPVAKTEP